VVHVRVANTLREDNARKVRLVPVPRIPAHDVADGRVLRVGTLEVIGTRRAGETRSVGRIPSSPFRRLWSKVDLATVGGVATSTCQAINNLIEGVVRRVPTRVRQGVVQRSLIRNTKAAAHRRLAITEYVIRKANARSNVVVI